jgi:toluene monooxygenase system protein E
MSAQRTYWHLEGRGRVPSAYEIATTKLLYYPDRGFELDTPIARWYERYQRGSRLAATFASFADPRALTYASYVAEQNERETFVDRLMLSIDESGYDRQLDPAWVATLAAVLPVLRYPGHGLHMLACYVGQMAPEGRLVVTGAFQAMDELRRIQRIAQRMRQLESAHPGFGADAKTCWQVDAAWQPLRRLVERLLMTYDFGEASVATLLVFKPCFDALFMRHFARLAAERGDRLLLELLSSLDLDCRWHAEWAEAFVLCAGAENPATLVPIREWIDRWWPEVRGALAAVLAAWRLSPARVETVLAEIELGRRGRWHALGVSPRA